MSDDPHDVVLVTEQGPVSRYEHPSREAAKSWVERNEDSFDGYLVIMPKGERISESE